MAVEESRDGGQGAFAVEAGGASVLRVRGDLTLGGAAALWDELGARLAAAPPDVRVDLSGVRSADPAALALLLARLIDRLRAEGAADVRARIVGAPEPVARVIGLLLRRGVDLPAPPASRGLLAQIGDRTYKAYENLRRAIGFLGAVVAGIADAARRPGTVRWRDVPLLAERAGADALAVVVTVTFLAGLLLAFQMAQQLRGFGADELIARLIGLAVVGHMAPFTAALMVAGRSGSAIAAELGTMRVARETDALLVMGVDPVRFLVFPRILALLIALPVLTACAAVAGVLGGLLIGVWQLDVTVPAFMTVLRRSLGVTDVVRCGAKSVTYSVTIALIACERGLATTGGAQSVGRSATQAVVAILFVLVALEALYAAAEYFLGG